MAKPTSKNSAGLAHVFDQWETEREQLYVLAAMVEQLLNPSGNGDCTEHAAWRLVQVMCDRLGSTTDLTDVKRLVGFDA